MDPIIEKFPKIVRDKLKNHVKKIILFGSRARGDFNEGSDYDFVIIVDIRNHQIDDLVTDAGSKMLSDYDTPIGAIVWNEEEWDFHKRFPIGMNILKEGIEL